MLYIISNIADYGNCLHNLNHLTCPKYNSNNLQGNVSAQKALHIHAMVYSVQ